MFDRSIHFPGLVLAREMEGFGSIALEAWEHTVYLAKETAKVVVYGETTDKSFSSKGFSNPTEVAVLGIVCLFNPAVFQIAKVSCCVQAAVLAFLASCRFGSDFA